MVLSIVRLVYSLLFMLGLPIIFCRLFYKGAALPAYRKRWKERLGMVSFIKDKKAHHPIWVHAASLGEIRAAIPLIKALQSQYTNTPILVTTMTVTGSEHVLQYFKGDLNQTLFHSYIPYDIGWIMSRFIASINPIALIIMETELWPNLIGIHHKRNIPIIIANARLSPKSVKRYQALGGFMKLILKEVTWVSAQSRLDVERYARLGMDKTKILYTGNLKYNLVLPLDIKAKGDALRARWDTQTKRTVFIAASTHPGEETEILSVFLKLKKTWPELLLVLVPRHPNRFEVVYDLCLAHHLNVVRATQPSEVKKIDVFLGDTMGELWTYYAASDCVFLGGSLVPVGGHNFLEPAALALPILSGPYLANCAEIAQALQAAQGLIVVKNTHALQAALNGYLLDFTKAKAQGLRAQKVFQDNQGALTRTMALIHQALGASQKA